jgi:hypothetical protein
MSEKKIFRTTVCICSKFAPGTSVSENTVVSMAEELTSCSVLSKEMMARLTLISGSFRESASISNQNTL